MKITTKATNITISPEIADYLDKKIKSFEKFIDASDESIIIDVELGRSTRHHQTGDIFRAEFNLHMAGKSMRAVSETPDLHASIDEAKDQMLHELRNFKTKRQHFLRRGSQKLKEMLRGMRPPRK